MPAAPGEIVHLYPDHGHARSLDEAGMCGDQGQAAAVGPERPASIQPWQWLAFVAFLVALTRVLACEPARAREADPVLAIAAALPAEVEALEPRLIRGARIVAVRQAYAAGFSRDLRRVP